MPPKKKASAVLRRHLTPLQRRHLLNGTGVGPAAELTLPEGVEPEEVIIFPDEDTARRAWLAHRSELLRVRLNPGHRPGGFWRYDPDVPEGLRADLPRGDPRWIITEDAHLDNPPAKYRGQERAYLEHRRARLEWLVGDGRHHLWPGEADYIQEQVARISDGVRA